MPHNLKFYLLSSAKKGDYLLKRGDKEHKNEKIGNAIAYYTEALEYCRDEAQERLNKITPLLFPKSTNPPPQPNQDPASPFTNTEQPPQSLELSGPYFPTSHVLSETSSPSSSSPISYTGHDVQSTLALVKMFKQSDKETKKHIRDVIYHIFQQYSEGSGSKEYIQQFATLATIPDQQIFLAIVAMLLKIEKESSTFPESTIHGLAVILTCAPKEINLSEKHDILAEILERLQSRLEKTRAENNDEELVPLLRAFGALFDAMLCRKLSHLGCVNINDPIINQLTALSSDSGIDPEVAFLARYAAQSLAYIRNDGSLAMSIFRRGRLAIGTIVDTKSAIIEFDPSVFESVYEKIMSMSDFTIDMEWYQGLLFLDCQLAKEDLSGFETFILKNKLNSNIYFMQGVCLRLEQVASFYSNPNVTLGAHRLLQDILLNSESSVQTTARMVLDRMDPATSISSQSSVTIVNPPMTVTSTNSRFKISKAKYAPVWDKSWYADNTSHLLRAIQNTSNLESKICNPDKILPTSNSIHGVNEALMNHYSNQLTVQRVSGSPLDLELCFINLAGVEPINQYSDSDTIHRESQEKFIRMPSYEYVATANTKELIPIEDILNNRWLPNGNELAPKRILIIGRAGIGKTTLCKKLVHTFQKGHWNERFDSVLWLPLRLLKSYKLYTLEELLFEMYFTEGLKSEREGLTHDFIKCAKDGRILFILDGLDEFETGVNFNEGDPLQCFVKILLNQPNLIVTTRPYSNDRSLIRDVDLELETIGFSTENVKQYVESVFKEPFRSSAVMDFIQKTPFIQELVNIPIQLDSICFSWDELATIKEEVTITQLYHTIVKKLLCRDSVRMSKGIGGKMASVNLFENLGGESIELNMEPTVEFLGYLAFQGLKDGNQLVFDCKTLAKREKELYQHRSTTNEPELLLDLLDKVKESSILCKLETEATSNLGKPVETWNFIHLTFQEYFAATWLSKYFYSTQHNPLNATRLMDFDDTMEFIKVNKYNPRYEILWWMIAGQLSGTALTTYLQFLQGAPRDLIGSRHQLLIAGCFKESYSRLSADLSNQIQAELKQWLQFELPFEKTFHDCSFLGKHSVFPEEILLKSFWLSGDFDLLILKALAHHRHLKSKTVHIIAHKIYNASSRMAESILDVLKVQSTISKDSSKAFEFALQCVHRDVRFAAVVALDQRPILSDSTTALVTALQDKDWNVRRAAANAFGNRSILSDSIIAALVATLQDINSDVRNAAANALINQTTLSDAATTVLVSALQHQNWSVRHIAAITLGKQIILSDTLLATLVTTLLDIFSELRQMGRNMLGNRTTFSESTATALVTALQDVNWEVRCAAAYALGDQLRLTDSTTLALATSLQDTMWEVRYAAAWALSGKPRLSNSIIAALVATLTDIYSDVRKAVLDVFEDQHTLSDSTIEAIAIALHDWDSDVREAAIHALRFQSKLPDSIITALITALQGPHSAVRHEAGKVLRNQTMLSDSATSALISALQDANWEVRYYAAFILGGQSTLSDSATTALVSSLQLDHYHLRLEIAHVLRKQTILSDSTTTALVAALKDVDWGVRKAAASALGSQITLSDSTTTALSIALQDENKDVRKAVAEVLRIQTKLSDSATTALVTALQHEDLFRNGADSTKIGLVTALNPLSNATDRVKIRAVNVLGKESRLSGSTIKELVFASHERDSELRQAAVDALRNQSKRSNSNLVRIISRLGVYTTLLYESIGIWRVYSSVKYLTAKKIEHLYKNGLFRHSCYNYGSLFIHENKLQGYTRHGLNETEEISQEILDRIREAFSSIQKAGGISTVSYE